MKEQPEIKAVITFSVGNYRFCIPVHEVKAIITAPAISRLPIDGGGVEGVFDYQGKVVTAVSIRRKLGLSDQSGESDVWIISCATSVPVAFHVDAVMKVVPVNTLEWRQIEGLQVDSIDRYALYENEIFFLTSCESLLTMPEVTEKIETEEKECPAETETVAPDSSDEFVEAINHDGNAVETMDQSPTRSVREISNLAGANEKDHSSVKEDRNKRALQHSLNSVSRRSRFNTDRQQSHREFPKRKRHVSATPPKGGYRRSTIDKKPASFIAQHNLPHEIDRFDRSFGWKLSLGIIVSVALICVFLLFHFGTTGKHFASMKSPTVKEGAGFTGRLSDQNSIAGMSLHETGDGRSEEPVRLSGRQQKFDGKPNPAVHVVAVIESEQTIKSNEAKAGKISHNKVVAEHDNGGNIVSVQTVKPIEVLRVETKQYTVTVERSPAGKEVPKIEKPTPIVSYNRIIHIVVKGDTLWDIAERYLGNPFRYPELASLSNIRDPDWIYPGDVVRIVKKDPSQSSERS